MSKKGICFFAFNNTELDYIKFAMYASLQVKKHFKEHNQVCLITTLSDQAYMEENWTEEEINKAFDYVVIDEHTYLNDNMRVHYDSPWTEFQAPFHNRQKHDVYWMSPFDETLLLDIDYIVQTNHLEYLFRDDNTSNLQMFDKARYLRYDRPPFPERYLNMNGIPMWWSTVIYFQKSPEAKMFFDLWSHIADNYDYYKFLYGFPGKLFRTDYCVSIALHILNGMQHGDFVEPIVGSMLNMDQKDVIIESSDPDYFNFLAHDRDENWKNILVHSKNQDVHCMNKRNLKDIIDGYNLT
jgi:hypothetical protein|tara:strand:+ start:7018 stop:7905 length:888 start_codon:yes stop_codon:yes gene_type:complete